MNPAAHLAIIRQLIRHESCGPAGDYQADEQAGVAYMTLSYVGLLYRAVFSQWLPLSLTKVFL